MKRVAVAHLKGGVGKTTAAVNLAYLAARAGHQTLLVDFDAQGAATYVLRVGSDRAPKAKAMARGKRSITDSIVASDFPRLDLVPGSFSFRKLPELLADQKDPGEAVKSALKRLGKGYDVVVVDAPAGVSRESEAIIQAVHLVVCPVVPSPLALNSFSTMNEFMTDRASGVPLRGFFSMVDRRRRLHRTQVSNLDDPAMRRLMWPVVVPYASAVEKMTSTRLPLPEVTRRGAAVEAFSELWEHVAGQLRLAPPSAPPAPPAPPAP